ncbi:MAG: SdiA-regulated domain-containing protein [Chitinophagales bacterium]
MILHYSILTLLSFLFLLTNCQDKPIDKNEMLISDFIYNLNKYDEKYKLPKALNEISGIALLSKNELFAIQDEKAILYTYSLKEEEVTDKFNFGVDGDFEGLCFHNNTVSAVSSNGDFYNILMSDHQPVSVDTLSILNHKIGEIEGICFDAKANSYLIAFKGQTNADKHNERSIYKLDHNQKLHQQPYITIGNQAIRSYLDSVSPLNKGLEKVKKNLSPLKASFLPSDIDIHPINGDIYVLSSINELLIVIDANTLQIKYIGQFDDDKIPQPEGITFDQNGTMYISSEKAKNDEAVIVKYKMK